jgi:hypothetical protein
MMNCWTVSTATVEPAASRSPLIVVRSSGVAYDAATSASMFAATRPANRSSRPAVESSSLDVENRRMEPPVAVVKLAS